MTYWNTLEPSEYGFPANVEPQMPHPRWSQAKERLLGAGSNTYGWQEQPTLLYNSYEQYVGELYR
ncbi:MAG: hypothetical protein WA902_13475 [Thermosynechococcaceae cyanobacterium]